MRVVELQRDFVGQRRPVVAGGAKTADRVGERAGHQEVLLQEAQPLSFRGGVVGVEHACQRFGRERLGQRADEVAAAELLEVEVVRRGGGPESQRVDGLAAVADDRAVVRNPDQRRGPVADHTQRAASDVERAGEAHFDRFVGPRDLPRVGPPEPVVRLLVLPAIAQGLFEDAVLVAQAGAHAGNAERGH